MTAPTSDDLLGLVLAYEVFVALSGRGRLVTPLCREYPLLTAGVLMVTWRHLRRRTIY